MANLKCDVLVIGAGASGLMCALNAAERGLDVIILDPNSTPGRKLRITGKGRCNVTNACDVSTVMKNIPGDGRFLYSALSRFSPEDVMAFFESGGVPLKIERGNRVFPVSDKADDIADFLVNRCTLSGVHFMRTTAKKLNCYGGKVRYVITGDNREIDCSAAVICTGGLSYPLTGCDGSGYKLAATAGHSIVPTMPSLVPLESPDSYCRELQGFAPKNVVLRAYEDNNLIYREQGELLFTHFGVSGPLVLSASAHMRNMDKSSYRLEIDFKPALDEKKLDARLLRDFDEYKNKEFRNVLPGLVGKSMIPVVIELSGIPGDTKANEITREQRVALRTLLKAFPVRISGKRPIAEAIITSGGVDTKEVNPRTMESKLVSGLYFAGEVLNLDAYTGGFNLQIAWSTGFVAGQSVLKGKEYE